MEREDDRAWDHVVVREVVVLWRRKVSYTKTSVQWLPDQMLTASRKPR